VLHWRQAFDSSAVDELFALKSKPAPLGEIAELLGLSERDESLLNQFVTDREAPVRSRYGGPGLRWSYFGHACVLIESRDSALLTDPALSYPFDGATNRLTSAQLPPAIDFVLLTHAHQDHVLLETLLPLRARIGTILVPKNSAGNLQDPSLKLTLEACGFS